MSDPDIVVVGAGAAGLSAARYLRSRGVPCLVLEARDRVGGRTHTLEPEAGLSIDLGAGWLHSADVNPLTAIARAAGMTVDQTEPAWDKRFDSTALSSSDRDSLWQSRQAFETRLKASQQIPDAPADRCLEPGNRWNPVIDAVSTWVNGDELAEVSAHDFARYQDSGKNWRVLEGYGRLVAGLAVGLDVRVSTPVTGIKMANKGIAIETQVGTGAARAAIVTVPTNVLSSRTIRFRPELPASLVEAFAGLPLGANEKLYLSIADDFLSDLCDVHGIGTTTSTRTAAYQIRPLGKPLVEVFLGGALARDLAQAGQAAFAAFALDELAAQFGSAVRSALTPIGSSAWSVDPWARGSYSHAKPGWADARRALREPVGGRLFFAGEATSLDYFTTVHGAFESGIRAAKAALDTLGL